ncbi:MAG: hypothetical protein E7213_04430 [Clostridium sp.]|nr:hypothetical protein [Clostridium sp.]
MNYNKTFQGSKRLLIDGIVGRETWGTLLFILEEQVCVHNDCMVTEEGVGRVLKAIPENISKSSVWNKFQTLTKGYGNTAEKAAAYSRFSKKDISRRVYLKTKYWRWSCLWKGSFRLWEK